MKWVSQFDSGWQKFTPVCHRQQALHLAVTHLRMRARRCAHTAANDIEKCTSSFAARGASLGSRSKPRVRHNALSTSKRSNHASTQTQNTKRSAQAL